MTFNLYAFSMNAADRADICSQAANTFGTAYYSVKTFSGLTADDKSTLSIADGSTTTPLAIRKANDMDRQPSEDPESIGRSTRG